MFILSRSISMRCFVLPMLFAASGMGQATQRPETRLVTTVIAGKSSSPINLQPTPHMALPTFESIAKRGSALDEDSCSKWLWQRAGLFWRRSVKICPSRATEV